MLILRPKTFLILYPLFENFTTRIAIKDNYHFTYNLVLFQNTFPDAGINQTLLTILALSPYFKKIQDIFYTIRPKLEYLQSEMMANNSEHALQDLAIR